MEVVLLEKPQIGAGLKQHHQKPTSRSAWPLGKLYLVLGGVTYMSTGSGDNHALFFMWEAPKEG